MVRRRFISAGCPNRWTNMMALVRLVIARSTAAGSRLKQRGSISANTGTALHIRIAAAEADMVYGLTITSSPGPQPRAAIAACRQEVADFIATACATPKYS